ncbi:hypothetical protein BJ742DRAFT_519877 [Cladochytrium replicatum]|nr:hypothetical protein BJ742DRAFT_519877 [Cladochytrium replicatum]
MRLYPVYTRYPGILTSPPIILVEHQAAGVQGVPEPNPTGNSFVLVYLPFVSTLLAFFLHLPLFGQTFRAFKSLICFVVIFFVRTPFLVTGARVQLIERRGLCNRGGVGRGFSWFP